MNLNVTSRTPILLSATVALVLTGCAQKRNCDTSPSPVPVKIAPVQGAAINKDSQIAALKVAIAEAKSKTTTIVKHVASENAMYPPNAETGKCYARVLIPAKYEIKKEKVLASEETHRVQVIPAKYTWVTKKVLIKEASERLIAVPATYKVITEKILVSPASQKIVPIPAIYGTVVEKVLIREAHTTWKQGRGPIEKLDNATCEIMCLVNVPALYKKVTKKVLKTPASTKIIPIPAIYKTVKKKVLDKPASTKVMPIVAQFKTVKVKELAEVASVKKSLIPETYRTVETRIKVSDAILKWQPILCKTSMSTVNIKAVQTALKESGFNPGPIDGIMGWRTKAALHKFQKSNGLSTGALTKETLVSLGV